MSDERELIQALDQGLANTFPGARTDDVELPNLEGPRRARGGVLQLQLAYVRAG